MAFGPIVSQAFFARDALEVAPELLGQVLVAGEVALRISEVEAYRYPGDSANHCFRGRTARNAPMWGPPGHCYVYMCYGVHMLLNLVTGAQGEGAAVLVRAGEPVAGHVTIARRRGLTAGATLGPAALAGPGKVAQALALDRSFNDEPVYIRGGRLELHAGTAPNAIVAGPRVGVDYAAPRDRRAPWRFAIAGSPWVSHRRTLR